jgi:hypothetical protein
MRRIKMQRDVKVALDEFSSRGSTPLPNWMNFQVGASARLSQVNIMPDA